MIKSIQMYSKIAIFYFLFAKYNQTCLSSTHLWKRVDAMNAKCEIVIVSVVFALYTTSPRCEY